MTAATASVVTQVAGSASGIALRLAAVSMVPGSTALARIFRSRPSIEVVRVSPRDATSIFRPTPDQPKLAGSAIHHFGGFFSADWRRNDIMWGRLDAAERLINLLLEKEENTDQRDELIQRARSVRGVREVENLLHLPGEEARMHQ